MRGEPGVGKTALLDYLAEHASGSRVAHASAVEAEMELAYARLPQLLTLMLDRLERLPAPQREALRTAFGLSAGSAPDRFLVGLATWPTATSAASWSSRSWSCSPRADQGRFTMSGATERS
jgi:hypothetical protein